MKILMVGDIIGAPGRAAFERVVPAMKEQRECDVVIANAENAAGGKGITGKIADEIFKSGADLISLGDHAWDQKDLAAVIGMEPRLVRPANSAPECPGKGWGTVETGWGKVTVISLLGRVFMDPVDCPFHAVDRVLKQAKDIGKIVVVDLHAEATSEKAAMGFHLDGRVSAVVGTHTHVQTSDERVLPGGTAFITDLGMTGPVNTIIGCDPVTVMPYFLTGMKSRFEVGKQVSANVLEGAILDIDPATGRAKSVERVRR